MSHPSNSSPSPISEARLDALVAQERTRVKSLVVAPLTEWSTLAAALREEGLLTAPSTSGGHPSMPTGMYTSPSLYAVAPPRQRRGVYRWGVRTLTGAALVGVGFVVGQATSVSRAVVPIVRQAIHDDSLHGVTVQITSHEFKSPAEARKVLTKSQTEYQHAAAYLAATDTAPRIVGGPELYQERLAALDEVVAATRNALKDAPHDPLLNQYYLSTVGAREATLQQLNQVLPVGVRVSHF